MISTAASNFVFMSMLMVEISQCKQILLTGSVWYSLFRAMPVSGFGSLGLDALALDREIIVHVIACSI